MKKVKSFFGVYAFSVAVFFNFVCIALIVFSLLIKNYILLFSVLLATVISSFAAYLVYNNWIKFVYFLNNEVYERNGMKNYRKLALNKITHIGLIRFGMYERFIFLSTRALTESEKSDVFLVIRPDQDDIIIVHYSEQLYTAIKKMLPGVIIQ